MKLLIITLLVLAGFSVQAEENAFEESNLKEFALQIQSDGPNPFLPGTEKIVLTEKDKATLADYAYTSKSLLERALRAAQGKALEESHEIYVAAIKQVVMESFADKKRSELLLRYALNQALQLTIGVPTADGRSLIEKGVLADVKNIDVITVILEDSMRLAIRYYQEDYVAIQSGSLVKLPYIVFGNERLAMAQKWSHSVHQPELLLAFQTKTLEQWMATVANNESLGRYKIAEAILDVDQALADSKKPNYSALQKIRFLRGTVDTLFDTLRRLGFRITENAKPALSVPTEAPRLIVTLDINSIDAYKQLELINQYNFRGVIGQGYTNMYYFKKDHESLDAKYKSYKEAEFQKLVEKTCAELVPAISETIICAPTVQIPRLKKYVSNREFHENYTVPFVIGIFRYRTHSPTGE